ncbi:MAG: PAS domain S-box protein [bacterium]|nr:PAS domain S-box protein [bacterium]
MAQIKIVIVEDEQNKFRDDLEILIKLQYLVHIENNLDVNNLDMPQRQKPDLILLPVFQDVDNKIEQAEEIQKNFHVPVIYYIDINDEEIYEKIHKKGTYGIIFHPIRDKELQLALENGIKKHKLWNDLIKSESWIPRIVEQTGEAIVSFDRNGLVTYINHEAEIITGWDNIDACGNEIQTVFPIFYEKPWAKLNLLHRVLQQGVVEELSNITILVDKYGVSKAVEFIALPIKNNNREISGGMIVFDDVTEKKYFKSLLKERESQYRDIIENANDIIFKTDQSGSLIYLNSVVTRILGYTVHELIGTHFLDLILPEFRKITESLVKEQIQKATPHFVVEFPVKSKSGKIVWLSQNTKPVISNNEIVGFHAIARDISIQMLIGKKLQESEKRFREMASLLPDPVFEAELDGTVTFANDAAYKMFGYTKEDIETGLNILNVLAKNEHIEAIKYLKEIMKRDDIGSKEFTGIRKDGASFPCRVNTKRLLKMNQPVGLMGVAIDISEQKRVQKELTEAKESAENANKAKSTFLANMSHELKTPLNSIMGHCRLLEMQQVDKLSEKQLEYISIIQDSGQHLLKIITDLLDISKVEAGNLQIERTRFDFNQMITRLYISIKPLADEKSIIINLDIEEGLGVLNADKIKIKQVIYNLLSNAIKFTHAGKRIGIESHREDKNILLTVWDEGIGIPKKDLPEIFDQFKQVVVDKAVKNKGTGLGLSITKKLVELHGGTIIVTSKPDEGSIFTVTLPLQ